MFDCGAYVYLPADVRANKLAPKSELMCYIDHSEGMKAYKFMRLHNNTIFIGTTAIFDEELFPKCSASHKKDQSGPVNWHRGDAPNGSTPDQPIPMDDDDEFEHCQPLPHYHPRSNVHDDAAADQPLPELEPQPQPPAPADEPQQLETEEAPRPRRSTRQRQAPLRPGNVYGDRRDPKDLVRDLEGASRWRSSRKGRSPTASTRQKLTPGPSSAPRHDAPGGNTSRVDLPEDHVAKLVQKGGVSLINYLLAKAVPPSDEPIPKTFRDIACLPAAAQQEWKKACLEELEALRKRKVFEVVDLPPGRKAIRNRWVFAIKSDGRKKARLVAKGFSQVEGIDFDEIFSPVVRYESVRLMIATAALEDWTIQALDVKSAFLYADLDEKIYMEQPEGFKTKGQEHKVMRLRKALYGLKQAALSWWKALEKSMKDFGFKRL